VKAFLAGERGICPECNARFVVPVESGGLATVVEEAAVKEVAAPVVEEVEAPPQVATPPAAAPPLPQADSSLPDVWYVRLAGGGQYGPADTETLHGWVAEGRVSHDSWVWRTGWPDWKKGVEALAQLNAPITAPPKTDVPTPAVAPTAPIEVAASKPRRSRRSSRRERAKNVTMALSALVLLLLVALVLVLSL
jgi:hypothetical protein